MELLCIVLSCKLSISRRPFPLNPEFLISIPCSAPHDTMWRQDTAPIVVALSQALPDVLNASVGELNFKNVINKLGDVMYTFPFSLPPYYIAIIRCLGVLEGVAIQVTMDYHYGGALHDTADPAF